MCGYIDASGNMNMSLMGQCFYKFLMHHSYRQFIGCVPIPFSWLHVEYDSMV